MGNGAGGGETFGRGGMSEGMSYTQ